MFLSNNFVESRRPQPIGERRFSRSLGGRRGLVLEEVGHPMASSGNLPSFHVREFNLWKSQPIDSDHSKIYL
jgi:hypothetical protein